jgi:PAS domain-containing protein
MTRLDDFSTLFELLPIGAYRMSPDGSMLRANAAMVQINGARNEADLRKWFRFGLRVASHSQKNG